MGQHAAAFLISGGRDGGGRIVDSGKFPRFSELMSGFMSSAEPPDPQAELKAAVELILDGIAARLEAAALTRPGPAAR